MLARLPAGLAPRSVPQFIAHGRSRDRRLWSGNGPLHGITRPLRRRRIDAGNRINANLPVPDIAAARDFYTDCLGSSVEEFSLGWAARYRSPSGKASVQLVTRDATAPDDSVISYGTDRQAVPDAGSERPLTIFGNSDGRGNVGPTCRPDLTHPPAGSDSC